MITNFCLLDFIDIWKTGNEKFRDTYWWVLYAWTYLFIIYDDLLEGPGTLGGSPSAEADSPSRPQYIVHPKQYILTPLWII